MLRDSVQLVSPRRRTDGAADRIIADCKTRFREPAKAEATYHYPARREH
jgi:hypothetical protein